MKKYILLTVLVFCVNIAFSQKYSAESIEEGLRNGTENVQTLRIRFDRDKPDLTKLYLFKNLKEVSIYDGSQFYDELFSLPKLEDITFTSSKQKIIIPSKINQMSSLKSLSIDKTVNIPESLFEMRNLERLNLDNIESLDISEKINNLVNLKNLGLFGTYFIKAKKFNFNHLESLILSMENEQLLPDMSALTNLKFIKIQNKSLKSLPPFPISISLRTLIIDAPLETLPENIGENTNLSYITLKNTHLSDLPQSLSKLKIFVSLTIRGGKFKTIPSILTSCTSLGGLEISHSQIEDISNMEWQKFSKNLRTLILSYNPISKLPVLLPPNLGVILLNDTKITSIPDEWIHKDKNINKNHLIGINVFNTNISQEEWIKINKKINSYQIMIEKDGPPDMSNHD